MQTSEMDVNALPDETLLAVFEALTPHGLLTAELVCQRWREVATAHSQVLWKPLFERSPFSRWWLPYRPSDDFVSLKERKDGKRQRKADYKWEYLTKSQSTERWLKFASFHRVSRGMRDHGEDYGGVVKWSRNESAAGGLGPARIAIRVLLVGSGGVGCNALSSALAKLFPGVCISLDTGTNALTNPLAQVQLVITRDEVEQAEALLSYKREVAGTPFMLGHLPLELEFEVADIFAVEGRCELVRNELYESVRPTVVLAAFSLEDSSSFNKLRETVLPAVRSRFNDLPVLAVGTKLDTRQARFNFTDVFGTQFFINSAGPTHEQGLELAYEIGARDYVECSILTREGLPLVVREAAELGVRHMLQFFARTDLENRPKGLQWEAYEGDQTEVHETISCNGCGVAPVVGDCYKCDTCPDYHLCLSCFRANAHNPHHTFKLWHTKKRRQVKRHVQRTTSFREGFRHRSSFAEDGEGLEGEMTAASASGEGRRQDDESEQEMGEKEKEKETEREKENEDVRREKEEIVKKGSESFKKTGLGESWKKSVEDIFRMFSKSPESKTKRKRTESSSSHSSDGAEDLVALPSSSQPKGNKKPRADE